MIASARRAFALVMVSALAASAQRHPPAEEGPRPIAVLKHGAEIGTKALRFSPDGKTLASGGTDGYIRLWDVVGWRERAALEAPSIPLKRPAHGFRRAPVSTLAFSPDGKILATGGEDGAISLWDHTAGRHAGALDGHPWIPPAFPGDTFGRGMVFDLAFSPDGRTLASTGLDQAVRLWDMPTREGRTLVGPPFGGVNGLAFSADSRRLAMTDSLNSVVERVRAIHHQGHLIRIWDIASGRPAAKIPASNILIDDVTFSPDGRWLASASGDGLVKLWDASTYKELATIKGHRGTVAHLAFSKRDSILASAGPGDHTVRLWRIPSGEPLAVLGGFKGPVYVSEFSPSGRTLAAAGREGLIRVWDLQDILDAAPHARETRGPGVERSPETKAPVPGGSPGSTPGTPG
jgi:hypothetical protein